MATPQQIDEQIKLERLQISQGIEQLVKKRQNFVVCDNDSIQDMRQPT